MKYIIQEEIFDYTCPFAQSLCMHLEACYQSGEQNKAKTQKKRTSLVSPDQTDCVQVFTHQRGGEINHNENYSNCLSVSN